MSQLSTLSSLHIELEGADGLIDEGVGLSFLKQVERVALNGPMRIGRLMVEKAPHMSRIGPDGLGAVAAELQLLEKPGLLDGERMGFRKAG